MLDVEIEFFDPNPDIDFHGLKTLLRQLFDVDNQLFDLSALTELILSQRLLGTTVKCDGMESDPYAFLTVLNMHEHREKPIIQQLAKYLTDRASGNGEISKLLAQGSSNQVGLILAERFINMPHQIVPSMYNMLLEEIQWANDDKEPYQFTHYVFVSKTYTEVASTLDTEDDRPKKKSKAKTDGSAETFYFHPEDEVLERFATATVGFEYERNLGDGASDARRTFQDLGVKPQGKIMVIEASKFSEAVKAVEEFIGAEA